MSDPKWLERARERLAAGLHTRVGSDLHLLEMAVRDYDKLQATIDLITNTQLKINRLQCSRYRSLGHCPDNDLCGFHF